MGFSIKAFSVTAQGTQGPVNNGQSQWTPAYLSLHLAAGVRVPGLDTGVQGIGGCHMFYLNTPLLLFLIAPEISIKMGAESQSCAPTRICCNMCSTISPRHRDEATTTLIND